MQLVPSINYFFGRRGFEHGNPAMSRRERWLLRRYLLKCRFLLEFGCGGSTLSAIRFGVPRIISVESDPKWVKRLQKDPIISVAVASGCLSFRTIDIGPVGNWGIPVDNSRRDYYPSYFDGVWSTFNCLPDLILIDGRFRVECAQAAISRVGPSTILLIHDYVSRPEYHVVERYLEPIDRANDLVAFRKRPR
ncbi:MULTISPECIES: hypothetical protein [Rhodoplanes]|nr:hypothetical protein [Rhodoplanes serenus]